MPSVATKHGQRKLSEVARHIRQPAGIVSTGWPAVRDRLEQFAIPFDLWQEGAGRLILAKREDGIYAAGVGGVIISIPRQVGKTYMIGWIVFALCTLIPGLTVIWTAHHTRTSNETFGKMRSMARKAKVAPYIETVRAANGEQSVVFKNGSRILFGARDQGFGLGFDMVDILVLDEGQRVKEVAMADMVPATNAAPNGLVIMMGTPPRPTDNGEVFTNRRKDALAGDPDTLYIELSADTGASIIDWDQVAKANPSFPHRTSRTAILRMQKLLGSDEGFYREGYGIWDEAGALQVITPTQWGECLDRKSKVKGAPAFALDVSPSRAWASIAVAGYGADGLPHVEVTSRKGVVDHRAGVEWVVPRAVQLQKAFPDFVLTLVSGSSAEPLIPELTEAGIRLEFVKAADLSAACGLFFDRATSGGLRHVGQPELSDALASARKNVDDGEAAWKWGRRKSAADITPLYAVTIALWALTTIRVAEPSALYL